MFLLCYFAGLGLDRSDQSVYFLLLLLQFPLALFTHFLPLPDEPFNFHLLVSEQSQLLSLQLTRSARQVLLLLGPQLLFPLTQHLQLLLESEVPLLQPLQQSFCLLQGLSLLLAALQVVHALALQVAVVLIETYQFLLQFFCFPSTLFRLLNLLVESQNLSLETLHSPSQAVDLFQQLLRMSPPVVFLGLGTPPGGPIAILKNLSLLFELHGGLFKEGRLAICLLRSREHKGGGRSGEVLELSATVGLVLACRRVSCSGAGSETLFESCLVGRVGVKSQWGL